MKFLLIYVPNLRFPYKGDWHKRKLNEICLFFKGNGLSKSDLSNEGFPCILYGELYTTYKNEVISDIVSKTTTTLSNPFLSKNNDLIIPGSGEDPIDIAVARAIYQNDIILGGDLNVLRPKSNVSAAFLSYQLNGVRRYDIAKKAQGKSIVHLHNSDLKEVLVSIPSYDEQLHIVKLLTKIDEMIETQSKIIEEYVILKNSLIHRFFTMDNPKVKLSTILTEINIKNKNKQIDTVLSVSNKLGFIKQSEQFEDREVASDDTSNYKIVNKGDYAYNPARINVGSIARLINYDKGIISPMYSCFKINEKKITYTYFDMFLSSFSFKRQLNKKLEGSVRQCLTFEGMLSMDIELPCIETQKSISNKIDMLNYKIKLESDYREALIKQKQFLLNNMFI